MGFSLSIIAHQNMYEDGDDEMKKTIAKAWTDARSGKPGPGPNSTDTF